MRHKGLGQHMFVYFPIFIIIFAFKNSAQSKAVPAAGLWRIRKTVSYRQCVSSQRSVCARMVLSFFASNNNSTDAVSLVTSTIMRTNKLSTRTNAFTQT